MRIPPFKKFQFCGSILMACGLFNAGSVQSLMLLVGSIMVLVGLCGRMYLIHFLFRIPASNSVLKYLFIPMSAFLLMDMLIAYQPVGIQPGMWHYLLIWTGAVLGMTSFIHIITRRMLALPWQGEKQK
jgi:hypothetical protein